MPDRFGDLTSKTLPGFGLREYPSPITPLRPSDQLTMGDLYANSMKLVYFLIQEGVLELPAKSKHLEIPIYNHMYNCYDDSRSNQEKFENFAKHLAKFRVNPVKAQNITIRLLGSEVASEGKNDYFTLLILQKLTKEIPDLNLEILFSPQAFKFLKVCEQGFKNSDAKLAPSLTKLDLACKQGVIEPRAVTALIDQAYKPNIKLLSYVIKKQPLAINIYSNCPVNLATIAALAEKFEIADPKDQADLNIEKLTTIIDQINLKFSELIKESKLPTSEIQAVLKIFQDHQEQKKTYKVDHGQTNFSLYYTHAGEVSTGRPDPDEKAHVVNLTTDLGKYISLGNKEYRVEKLQGENYTCKLPAANADLAAIDEDVLKHDALDLSISEDPDLGGFDEDVPEPEDALEPEDIIEPEDVDVAVSLDLDPPDQGGIKLDHLDLSIFDDPNFALDLDYLDNDKDLKNMHSSLEVVNVQDHNSTNELEPGLSIDTSSDNKLEPELSIDPDAATKDDLKLPDHEINGLNLRTIKIIQHDKYRDHQNVNAIIDQQYMQKLHEKLTREIKPPNKIQDQAKEHYSEQQLIEFKQARENLYRSLEIEQHDNKIHITENDQIACSIKPSSDLENKPASRLLINGSINHIDLLLNSTLQSKKLLGNNCKYIIYPSSNIPAVIELYSKAKACGLEPELRNYPEQDGIHRRVWSQEELGEIPAAAASMLKKYEIPKEMEKKPKFK